MRPPELTPSGISAVLVAAGVVVLIGPLWTQLRLMVTLVHELGHGLVGALGGRTFTGFVISGDGSGHAVTSGRPRGFARIATTWAGYPMPGLVGAGLIFAALAGWSRAVLAALVVIVVVVLIRVRSALTLLVLLVCGGALGWLWWSASATVQGYVLVGLGVLLVVGAWRHVYVAWRTGRAVDDHRVLAQLTGIPALGWLLSWVLVLGAVTWVAGQWLWAAAAH